MVLYCTYYIQFCLNGETETQTKRYRACSPGEAFQKCHRRFLGSQLIQSWRQSERNGERAITYYEAPSTISIAGGAENRVGADLFWLRKSAFFQTERIELALGRTGFVTKSSLTQN